MYTCDYQATACAYYIRFFTEESVPEALWGHPSVGNLDGIILVLSKVASDVHIFSEPKVSNLYVSITIQPRIIIFFDKQDFIL